MRGKIVTLDEVKFRVKKIKAFAWDDEAAHGMEDDLWRDVLYTIANVKAEGIEVVMATEAYNTCGIRFSRWTA